MASSRADKIWLVIAIVLFGLSVHKHVKAQELIVHGYSYHSVGDLNNANYGIGYKFDGSPVVVGTYYNSESNWTVYSGASFNVYSGLSLTVGVATGYKRSALTPLVMADWRFHLSPRVALHIGVAPAVVDSSVGVLLHSFLSFRI